MWWDEERYERKTGGLNSIFTFWITFIKKSLIKRKKKSRDLI